MGVVREMPINVHIQDIKHVYVAFRIQKGIIQRGCGEVGRRVGELTCYQRVHAAKGKVWFIICLFQLRSLV